MRSSTSSFLFAVRFGSGLMRVGRLGRGGGGGGETEPSKTSGGSTFSGLRCLVTGISSETWTKLTREVRYAMLRDMIVRS